MFSVFLFLYTHLIFRESHLYINRRVCYSCTVIGYRRPLCCWMQFKLITCQQMPCVIWHCRKFRLFCFLFRKKRSLYFFFHYLFFFFFFFCLQKEKICDCLVPLTVDSAASCCNYFGGDGFLFLQFFSVVILLTFLPYRFFFFVFYLYMYFDGQ